MESMFFAAEHFEQKMCEWNLEGKNVQNMFTTPGLSLPFQPHFISIVDAY